MRHDPITVGAVAVAPIVPAAMTRAARAATKEAAPTSEAALATLLALTDDGILLVDRDERVADANHAAVTMLAQPGSARIVGETVSDVFDVARARDMLGTPVRGSDVWARLASPTPLRLQLGARRGDAGRTVRVTRAHGDDGSHVLLLRDQSALLAAEELGTRYRQAVETTLDGVYLASGKELRVDYANAAAARQTDQPRDALIGRPLTEIVPRLDLTPQHGFGGWSGGRAGDPATTVLRTRNGQLKPVDAVIQHLGGRGDDARAIAIVRDATERVESQVRLQRLIQQQRIRSGELEATLAGIGDAVIVCDAEGRVVLANPAARDLFPNDSLDTLASLGAELDDPDALAAALGQRRRHGPVELPRTDGDRWLELSTFPLDSGADNLAGGTIILARDATLTRDARRVRETFLGILSHELRTPITTILGGIKVLRRHEEEEYPLRAELQEDIEAEAERLYRLVEDLLILARIEDSRVEPMMDEPLLLRRLLPSLLASEQARWPGRHFDVTVPVDLAVVVGDRTYLEQILRNLLGNAAKYSPPGTPIEIRVEAEPGEVRVRVLDEGAGFAAEEAERLFDLYYRSPRTTSVAGGAGIGLFVCRILVEAMGGRIWALPREGGGAEFGFALRTLREESE